MTKIFILKNPSFLAPFFCISGMHLGLVYDVSYILDKCKQGF